MSTALYPLSLIASLKSTRLERTLADSFEDGTTATRATWPLQYFKRQLEITHAPLTLAEFRYLRSFYSQRTGRYDSFYFRDNVHREGNVNVRFVTDLPSQYQGRAYRLQVKLEEIAPLRALPEFDEVTTAAGIAPLLWYDANREIYYTHAGSAAVTENSLFDSMLANSAPWQTGALGLGGIAAQYQHYAFTGQWAKTTGTVLAGTLPACTICCFAKISTTSSNHVLCQLGTGDYGLFINEYNNFRIGAPADDCGTPYLENTPADTWRSVAGVLVAGGTNKTLYVNAALIAADTTTAYTFTGGAFSVGAQTNGTNIMNAGNTLTNANLGHVLVFPAALSNAQIKAVHNLLAYQYGVATVP